jgi:hypothetical protein
VFIGISLSNNLQRLHPYNSRGYCAIVSFCFQRSLPQFSCAMDDPVVATKFNDEVLPTQVDTLVSSPQRGANEPRSNSLEIPLEPLDLLHRSSEPMEFRLSKIRDLTSAYQEFKNLNSPQNLQKVERAYHSFSRASGREPRTIISPRSKASDAGSDREQLWDERSLYGQPLDDNDTNSGDDANSLSGGDAGDSQTISRSSNHSKVNRLNRKMKTIRLFRDSLDYKNKLRAAEERMRELESLLLTQHVEDEGLKSRSLISPSGEVIIKVKRQADTCTMVSLTLLILFCLWVLVVFTSSRRYPSFLS